MQRGVKSALINLKHIVRTPVNPLSYGITVKRSGFERFQDEHVQSPWNKISGPRFLEGFSSHK
jgi:hypothetical protein